MWCIQCHVRSLYHRLAAIASVFVCLWCYVQCHVRRSQVPSGHSSAGRLWTDRQLHYWRCAPVTDLPRHVPRSHFLFLQDSRIISGTESSTHVHRHRLVRRRTTVSASQSVSASLSVISCCCCIVYDAHLLSFSHSVIQSFILAVRWRWAHVKFVYIACAGSAQLLNCRPFTLFAVFSMAKRYILQQKCLKKWIGSCLLGTRRTNERRNAQRYRRTLQALRRHANSRDDILCSNIIMIGWKTFKLNLYKKHQKRKNVSNVCKKTLNVLLTAVWCHVFSNSTVNKVNYLLLCRCLQCQWAVACVCLSVCLYVCVCVAVRSTI